MATFANPSIASSGLVLNFDAGNPRSFTSEENFVLYSEDFSNAVWDKTTYPVTVALSTEAPPLPGMTVYSLTTTNNLNLIIQQVSTSITGQGQLTASVYAKAGTSTAFTLNPYYNGESEVNITFTLTGDGSSSGGGTITKLDNGWYRCSCPVPATTATRSVYLYRIWPETRGTYTTKTLYVAGAQTVTGGLSPYVRTTAAGISRSSSVVDATSTVPNFTINGPIYTGIAPNYFTFDGSNDIINASNSTALDTQTPTVEVWVKTNNTNQNGFWFEKGAVNTQYSLFQEGTNIQWRQNFSGVGITNLTTTTAPYMGTSSWYQVVGTFTSGSRILYINGVQVNSDTQTGTISTNSSGMSIGAYGGNSGTYSYYYNGSLAICRVYNRVLTATEVAQNFAASRQRFGL